MNVTPSASDSFVNTISSPFTVFSAGIDISSINANVYAIFPLFNIMNGFSDTICRFVPIYDVNQSMLVFTNDTSPVFSIIVPLNPLDVISIVCVLSASFSGNLCPYGASTSVITYLPGSKFSTIFPSSSVVTTVIISPFISSSVPTMFPFPSITVFPSSSVIVNLAPSTTSPS